MAFPVTPPRATSRAFRGECDRPDPQSFEIVRVNIIGELLGERLEFRQKNRRKPWILADGVSAYMDN